MFSRSVVEMHIFLVLGITLLCCTSIIGQPQPADFVLQSTKTNKELTFGKSGSTIVSWISWSCTLSKLVEPYESQWYFEDAKLATQSGRILTQDIQGFGAAILIQNLTYLDQGAYMCQVRGTDPLTTWASLTVRLTLEAHLNPVARVVKTYNDSLHIDIGCEMYGYIPPDENLYWFVDGKQILSSNKYRITFRDGSHKAQVGGNEPGPSRVSILSVYDVELSDSKTYTCAVRGRNLMEHVDLMVNEASSPDGIPQNIQVEAVSPTEIRVTWEDVIEEERKGNITHYEIICSQRTPTASGETSVIKKAEVPMSSLSIENLDAYVEYSITMRAHTIVGPGPFSPIQVTHTFEDVPSGSPRNLFVKTLGVNALDLFWSKPDDTQINGVLRYYVIQYCIINESQGEDNETLIVASECKLKNTTGDKTQLFMKYLEVNTTYNVSVAAFTIEVGPFASIIVTTGSGLPDLSTDILPTEKKKEGYSIVGTVVGTVVATLFLVILSGIVYCIVNYYQGRSLRRRKMEEFSEEGSTVSVSLSRDPELVLIPIGDGIALMRRLSIAESSVYSSSSAGDRDSVYGHGQIMMPIEDEEMNPETNANVSASADAVTSVSTTIPNNEDT